VKLAQLVGVGETHEGMLKYAYFAFLDVLKALEYNYAKNKYIRLKRQKNSLQSATDQSFDCKL
ncbi:hypothetical protein, partial [Streptomyces durmitorensis]